MGASVIAEAGLDVSYDGGGDVLYVSIGEPKAAVTQAAKNGLLIRSDPRTHQVVGITILDYENKFRRLADISWIEGQSLPEEVVKFLKRRPAVR